MASVVCGWLVRVLVFGRYYMQDDRSSTAKSSSDLLIEPYPSPSSWMVWKCVTRDLITSFRPVHYHYGVAWVPVHRRVSLTEKGQQ
ncbi:hypothetical protein F4824DRAFT_465601 [Ustulina deusta]|nr:hypothetical protein F4824DRAFT_465601 [Ustulina deusta]